VLVLSGGLVVTFFAGTILPVVILHYWSLFDAGLMCASSMFGGVSGADALILKK
jgi:hypothetical protein